jgi:hypothetical protein
MVMKPYWTGDNGSGDMPGRGTLDIRVSSIVSKEPIKPSRLLAALLLATAPLSLASWSVAEAALPRFPQPFGERIVFVADGNIWSVAKTGGAAVRLTSAEGQDMFPRVSPDGRWIAYTEASHVGTDVW